MTIQPGTTIGYVVGGSLKNNLNIRLTIPSNEVQEGSFVVIEAGNDNFYGLITDLQLGNTDPRFADEQSELRLPAHLSSLLHGQTLFTNLEVMPMLMLDRGPDPGSPEYPIWLAQNPENKTRAIPVKTIPAHHAIARSAHAGDVAEIFGDPEKKGNFIVGTTREQKHPVCLNLEKFIQRSSGIFGATGTGKSFLTRIILAGLIHHDLASLLVFDMHNEYGYDDTASDTNQKISGLRTKFPLKVKVVGLGAGASIRKKSADFNLQLSGTDIAPEDILMLTRELNLRETSPATLDALVHSFGPDKWFYQFKRLKTGAMIETDDGKKIPAPGSVAAWADQHGVNTAAAEALHQKLGRIFNKSYISENPPGQPLQDIIRFLEQGKHIILSFGDHEEDLDYLLVTNLLTRKIRQAWEKKTNDFRGGATSQSPRPLVIVVEEAHKMLNREMSVQTTFSTIAREMRKYYVTLLIIDQRPSQIYDEVMSQLGTRISGWLGDDADISAVLSGLAGRDSLRGMLSRLQPKEEVLMLGWGVPMPIPLRSRRYDQQFWDELLGKESHSAKSTDDLIKSLGFDA
ncbi:MAG: ATP-binding protein [Anaerolineaceae bacterium]|nr:ATP-binding protein [Anaerolineaceae bacterium]